MNAAKTIRDAAAAGLLISLVSYCYIMCENKSVGAALFAFGLIFICKYSLKLFTGMSGYVRPGNVAELIIAAAVNCVTAWLCGLCASMNDKMRERTLAVCESKFSVTPMWLAISAILCGMMIYLGVDFYKKHGSFIGIIFAIPIFVLSGFDHTVADMFYIGASRTIPKDFVFVIVILVAGNFLGSNIVRGLLNGLGGGSHKNEQGAGDVKKEGK